MAFKKKTTTKKTTKKTATTTKGGAKSKAAASADEFEDDESEEESEEEVEEDEEEETTLAKAPAGYEQRSTDVVGFYTNKGPIHCIPQSVTLSDSSLESDKTSCLIIATLIDPCQVITKDEEGGQVEVMAKKGASVGIWYKPGMKGIETCGGIPVFLQSNGKTQKMTKKGKNPMKLYDVKSPPGKVGTKLPVVADHREDSLHAKNPFVKKRPLASMADATDPFDDGGL